VRETVREEHSEYSENTDDSYSDSCGEEGGGEQSEVVATQVGEEEVRAETSWSTMGRSDSQSSPDCAGSTGCNDSPSSASSLLPSAASPSTLEFPDASGKNCACRGRRGIGGHEHDKGGEEVRTHIPHKPFHRWVVSGASGQGCGLDLSNFDLRSLLETLQT
jgi:hypothetical protein